MIKLGKRNRGKC